jgi:Ca-activated chloride channel family protein
MQGESSHAPSKRARSWLLSSLLVLLIIAASGPSWIEKPQPATQRSDNMVVVLDLSLSMLAEDTPPSRLVRAKQKIVDLLRLRKEGTTALIAFSGDSFVVTPLTDDIRTIESNLSALDPFIMPVIGSRPDLAIEQARELLLKAGSVSGRIVLLTDGIAEHQVGRINDSLVNADISLSIISVGTSEGGPIKLPDNRGYLKDNGSVVIAKMDSATLKTLTSNNGGSYVELSLNDSDLEAIDVSGARTALAQQENSVQRGFDQWEDLGFFFLALALPLCLLAYRQGGLLILALAVLPDNSQAFELVDLWKTKDQQAQEAATSGDYDAAAGLFESPRHKADALYRAGKFEQAAELYSQFDNAEGHYNRGNALARSQQIEEAIEAYEQALALDPQNSLAAENKALLESMLDQQQSGDSSDDSSENSSDSSSEDSSDNSSDSSDSKQQKSDKQEQSGSQNNSDKQTSEGQSSGQQDSEDSQSDSSAQTDQKNDDQSKDRQSGSSGEQEQDRQQAPQSAEDINEMNQEAQQAAQKENADRDEPGQNQQDMAGTALTPEQMQALEEQGNQGENMQSMAIEDSLTSEEQRSYEQWMRRVPDDPSGLLRRKFEQQARERVQENNPEEPLW